MGRTIRTLLLAALIAFPLPAFAAWKVVAWNDLGMHCTDGLDYSVFGVLPPYNTIHAQVIDGNGRLVRDASAIRVTYEAVADPSGSINTTSAGKTNFWTYVKPLFGAEPPVDAGLAGKSMPGLANAPQTMDFDPLAGWFTAEGIPITPYDDAGAKNPYPMMRVVVRSTAGDLLAATRIVLPVSDEMDCRSCHGPRSVGLGARETKLEILARHDELNAGRASYASSLQRAGFNAAGLVATVTGGTPVLCARCHASNALPGTGMTDLPSLTSAIHRRHASVTDPKSGLTLDAAGNRAACYSCHPGATTQCLRGTMGRSVRADGQLAIQCQNCHGSMSQVGAPLRNGWLDEPTCQNCHTGSAVANAGAIRFNDVFSSPGVRRLMVNPIFATTNGEFVAGFGLYRFSRGHGGLYCEACHGSTHAEFPSSHASDNLASIDIQGHAGVVAECGACHPIVPSTTSGGPHGMHPVGQTWVSRHGDIAERGTSGCQACHGGDLRGTVLSRTTEARSLTGFGPHSFWRGYRVGCYACHNGPQSESVTNAKIPTVSAAHAATVMSVPAVIALDARDPGGASITLHVVSPPQHGTAGIDGTRATYIPEPGFAGRDTFTFAAWNGSVESDLATVTIDVSDPGPRRRAVRR